MKFSSERRSSHCSRPLISIASRYSSEAAGLRRHTARRGLRKRTAPSSEVRRAGERRRSTGGPAVDLSQLLGGKQLDRIAVTTDVGDLGDHTPHPRVAGGGDDRQSARETRPPNAKSLLESNSGCDSAKVMASRRSVSCLNTFNSCRGSPSEVPQPRLSKLSTAKPASANNAAYGSISGLTPPKPGHMTIPGWASVSGECRYARRMMPSSVGIFTRRIIVRFRLGDGASHAPFRENHEFAEKCNVQCIAKVGVLRLHQPDQFLCAVEALRTLGEIAYVSCVFRRASDHFPVGGLRLLMAADDRLGRHLLNGVDTLNPALPPARAA